MGLYVRTLIFVFICSIISSSATQLIIEYQGCYEDQPTRDLSFWILNLGGECTPELCAKTCYQNGYTYAGTQFRSQCFCGKNSQRTYGRRPEDECNLFCSGDSNQYCGGAYRNMVYAISKVNEKRSAARGQGGYLTSSTLTSAAITHSEQCSTTVCAISCFTKNECIGLAYNGVGCHHFVQNNANQPECSVDKLEGLSTIESGEAFVMSSSVNESFATDATAVSVYTQVEPNPWTHIQLKARYLIHTITLVAHPSFQQVFNSTLIIRVAETPGLLSQQQNICVTKQGPLNSKESFTCCMRGQFLKIDIVNETSSFLALDDIQVVGRPEPLLIDL